MGKNNRCGRCGGWLVPDHIEGLSGPLVKEWACVCCGRRYSPEAPPAPVADTRVHPGATSRPRAQGIAL